VGDGGSQNRHCSQYLPLMVSLSNHAQWSRSKPANKIAS
jgi:hypothetical protein